METLGKKLRECREAKKLSQNELVKLIEAHHSIIGKYERDEVKPSIDVVKKIANFLDTTVGYLLGETQDKNLLKDPAILKRLNEISSFNDYDKEHILYAIDGLIKSVKIKNIAAL
ncbi:helix-turn-helix domain-containing protein [Plebeiibacterium sediminum]|uniref:Helix-turn-helix transcriptional regulator n=1 Tax=Plebeiibacterium sediminum TaxID=2992112 RepID=A0AAE3M6D6_9BACT|nr:helix-turn-helix transcriptional regulator [Plebeiobacterium sediminum]MCW3787913.1 helix-turn-helix transcriptional regulator [Plebeiobacterium sediminum]